MYLPNLFLVIRRIIRKKKLANECFESKQYTSTETVHDFFFVDAGILIKWVSCKIASFFLLKERLDK